MRHRAPHDIIATSTNIGLLAPLPARSPPYSPPLSGPGAPLSAATPLNGEKTPRRPRSSARGPPAVAPARLPPHSHAYIHAWQPRRGRGAVDPGASKRRAALSGVRVAPLWPGGPRRVNNRAPRRRRRQTMAGGARASDQN